MTYPDSYSVEKFDSPVTLQMAASCNSSAIVSAYENMLNQRGPEYACLMSWMFTHQLAGSRLRWQATSIENAMRSILDYGVCPISTTSYKGEDVLPQIHKDSFEAAKHYRAKSVKKITDMEDIISSIASNTPVVVVLRLAENIYHTVLAVGYDKIRGSLRIKNSLGSGYADNGYEWIPFDGPVMLREGWCIEMPDYVPVVNKWLRYRSFRLLLKVLKFIEDKIL